MEPLKLVLDYKADLGEGPCWDQEKQLLYWVNITANEVHIYDPQTGSDRAIQLEQYVTAVVPRTSGGLLLAMRHGLYFLDPDTEKTTFIADPESDLPDNRFNDGKCDAAGRFWAGTMGMGSEKNTGALYCLEPDLSIRSAVRDVTCSNGLAWSHDNKTMYYIDSPTKHVVAYDYDLATGQISNKRTVITIPEGGGVPDGMTIDAEGMLWVAQWDGHQVARWNPETGEMLTAIRVPAARVTSCTFGGKDLDELYITTARQGLDDKELAEQPHAGGLFCVKPGVKGLPARTFNG